MQPTLTTTRLVLRPAAPSDVDALWELWSHPDVRRYLWDDRTPSRIEAEAMLADCSAHAASGMGLWIIESAAGSGSALGCAALMPVGSAAEYEPRLSGLVEPVVALWPTVWGSGYAHETLTALQQHAHETLALRELAAACDVPNEASDRMLRRAGFDVLSQTDGPRYPLRTYLWNAPSATSVQQRLAL